MAETILETLRLVLRRWQEGDLEAWLTHLNTPQVRAYLGGVDTADKVAEKFAKLETGWDTEGFSFLAVDRRDDGAFVGTCGMARIKTECAPDPLRGAVQIGWQFRADCWGRGYATEAAQAVLAMAFVRHDLPRVYAQTSQRNRASWRVMERLGMTRLAALDYPDTDYPPEDNPTMVYGLERAAWRATQDADTAAVQANG